MSSSPSKASHPAKVLVVEDDPVTVKVYQRHLESAGYAVVTAPDVATATHLAKSEVPDLITVDVNLPDDLFGANWDGIQLVQWLRRLFPDRHVPVIVISGEDAGRFLERAAEAGVHNVLGKPVGRAELLAAVADGLAHAGRSSPPA